MVRKHLLSGLLFSIVVFRSWGRIARLAEPWCRIVGMHVPLAAGIAVVVAHKRLAAVVVHRIVVARIVELLP